MKGQEEDRVNPVPELIPGSDFPLSVFRSCTRQKDFSRVFMQSERLYVINTGEGKWIEHEVAGVEEEKSGIMRRQPVGSTTLWLFSTRLVWKHTRIYLQLFWSMITPLIPGQISIDVPPSYTNPHQALSEMSIFCQAVQVEQKIKISFTLTCSIGHAKVV